MNNDWFGGKPCGCVAKRQTHYQVLLSSGPRGDVTYTTKTFSFNTYRSKNEAFNAAKQWQYEQSISLGETKNVIRIVEPDDEDPYLEIQMQNGKIMKCDVEDIELVEDSIWTALKGKNKKCTYARRRASTKLNQEYAMFHSLLYPEWEQVDHINGDGLDNRRENLRDGSGDINARNKGIQNNNKSGVTGVYKRDNSWVAQIGTGKRKRSEAFSNNVYDNAMQMAINKRKEWEQELGYGARNAD